MRTEKLHRIKIKKVKKDLESIFYGVKASFFRANNFNVSKTLWSVLCWLLLWSLLVRNLLLECAVSLLYCSRRKWLKNAWDLKLSTFYNCDPYALLWLVEIKYCDFIGLKKYRKFPLHQLYYDGMPESRRKLEWL